MDQDNAARARSRKRPQSRASTTSIHSATTQNNMEPSGSGFNDGTAGSGFHDGTAGSGYNDGTSGSGFNDGSNIYSGQWMTNQHGHPNPRGQAPQMTPEDLIMHAAGHLQGTAHDFTVDGSIPAHMDSLPYQQQPQHHHPMTRHPLPAEQFGTNASFTEGDSQMLDCDDHEDESLPNNMGAPKRTGTRSSANNELEMRQLFSANRHRGLPEVAKELHGNERGPNSERTRQVFAMLWINTVCTKGKGSVPRGRVYANYASRCAASRITVLNPASFGKLVRVLFPGLKTRRLGVRGESKYHYVNFCLADDQPEVKNAQPQPPKPLTETESFTRRVSTPVPPASAQSQSVPPATQAPTTSHNARTWFTLPKREHSFYNQPEVASIGHVQTTTTKTHIPLKLMSTDYPKFDQSVPLALPDIEPFLPPGTDRDSAKSLSALYRSHCTSLVECIRYCREKNFFHLYTAFLGTLTMPVQKLFRDPDLAPWIEGCDIVLYQAMMRIVSTLVLQVVPKQVLDTFRNISVKVVPHIREALRGQPEHVLRAKEAPAVVFAGLLDRALRVNLTAHAAANMLANQENRDNMYNDWVLMVRPRKIAECVPARGMDDLVNLLINEMRDLLDPVDVAWEVEVLTVYGETNPRPTRQREAGGEADATGTTALDRWVDLLLSLPSKFPYASHGDIVWCVERVGTAVMRDLTLSQGKSFGTWWVTKTFLDEMVSFMAEQGGFMQQTSRIEPNDAPRPQAVSEEMTRQNTGSSKGSDVLNVSDMSHSQPGRAPFPPPNVATNGSSQAPLGMSGAEAVHDDSGIGIRTPEEDFPMDKFAFTGPDGANLMEGDDMVDGDDL